MVTYVLRFYGRFVMARERKKNVPTGIANFIAPTLEFPPEIGRHRPIMTVDRRMVAADQLRTSVPPTFRTITGPDRINAEHLIWDLSNIAVSVPSTGGFTFHPRAMVVDLLELEKIQKRDKAALDQANLVPNAKVGSVIHFEGGEAVSLATHRNRATFVPENIARAGAPHNGVSAGEDTQIADWIEVSVQVPSTMDKDGKQRGALGLQLRGRENGTVFIEGVDGTHISFSNLCSTCPRTARQFDVEFGQYYGMLQSTGDDHLVPVVTHLGQEDCNDPAQLFYDI